MDSCTQLAVVDSSEAVVKRMKKEPGAVTGKSVVVLKDSDVTTRNENVFMPNTIEMAQLKKPEKGQFKTNVQISSKMMETDIKRILVETFPFLEHQRFYCAAAVDNRTRLDFHGERRIWDGHFIKKKIKGNSALYIFTEEEKSGDYQDSKVSEQLTLKRPHDQITAQENEESEWSVKKEMESTDISKVLIGSSAYVGSEKQAKLHVYSMACVSSKEKSDNVLLNGAQSSRQKLLDKIPPSEGFVYVPVATGQQGMISPVWHSSLSSTHEARNAKDLSGANVGPTSLSPSITMGAIMVPAGEAVCPGAIPRAIISTTSDQQSLGKAVFHIAGATSDTRQTGLPSAIHRMPQVMVSSMLTPQMTNLKISNASSVQLQKPVYLEKSSGKRDQGSQTVESSRDSLELGPPLTTTPQNDKSVPVEFLKEAATGLQPLVELGAPDQSKQPTDKKNYSGVTHAAEKRGSMKDATTRQCDEFAGTSMSDHAEVIQAQLSDQTDSGIEISDNTGDVSLCKETNLALAMETTRREQKTDKLDEAEWKGNESGEEGGLSLLSGVASNALKIRSAVTKTESAVEEIMPKSCSLKGGATFVMILRERLPQDVASGLAYFGRIAAVPLVKINEFNMAGCVPEAPAPGVVSVKVQTSNGRYLGETSFEYTDVINDVLQMMLRDRELQAIFFSRLAKDLARKTDETEREQTSSLKIADGGRPGSTSGICRPAQLSACRNSHLGREDILETLPLNLLENVPVRDYSARDAENESDYDSDDEASSTDSSEDGDAYPDRGGFGPSSEIISCDTVSEDPLERNEIKNQSSTDGARRLCPFRTTRTPNFLKESTSVGLKPQAFCHVGNRCDEEQSCGEMLFFKLLKTEDYGIKDNLESLPSNLPESAPPQAFCHIDGSRGEEQFHGEMRTPEDVSVKDDLETLPSNLPESVPVRECSGFSHNHKNVTRSVWNRQVRDEELNPVDYDENSKSDKTQRAHFARRRNEMDNAAAANL